MNKGTERQIKIARYIFLSPSGDLGISLVWHNLSPPPHRSFLVRLLKSSSNWTKISMRGPLLSTSGYLGISLVWHNLSPPTHRSFLVRLLKSSSNWTKLSMMGPQLFSGWYQTILDVFRCSQLFSDVFNWVVTFMDNHPTGPQLFGPTVEILFKLN